MLIKQRVPFFRTINLPAVLLPAAGTATGGVNCRSRRTCRKREGNGAVAYRREALKIEAGGTKPIVFIIDDDSDVREGLCALLQSVSLDCEVFSTTSDFLLHKRRDAVSCLILDVRLPGPSGLDFQRQLATAHVGIPIVFLTGHGDIPMSVRAIKSGAVEFLTKPVREQDLLDAIRTALEVDRARREHEEILQDLRARFESLSERERKVMALVSAGLLNKQIAGEMNLSEVTIKVHRHNLMRKLAARSVPELVRIEETLGVGQGQRPPA
jgi:RNA polymerase sigma factor (sigma-70 family)